VVIINTSGLSYGVLALFAWSYV